MKTSLMIALVDLKKQELGIEEDDATYTRYFFLAKDFTGYWVVEDDDNNPIEIAFYVGGIKFFCKYNQKNLGVVEDVMKWKEEH